MGITAVLSVESADGLIVILVPSPTPGSVSKKYSNWLIGPEFAELLEIIKKVLDSVWLYPLLFLARIYMV
jgi:hypothetical protein